MLIVTTNAIPAASDAAAAAAKPRRAMRETFTPMNYCLPNQSANMMLDSTTAITNAATVT